MKEIIKKDWNYSFFEKDTGYILSVICGSVGLYEVNIQLNEEELEQYRIQGAAYIEELAKAIQYKPSLYTERHISDITS